MGKIEVLGKWDLANGEWIKNPEQRFLGRSFALAHYDKIINNNGKINYIIFAHGSRIEDHTSNYCEIKESKVGMKNIIDHYRNCNGNYAIKLFLMDADAPIIEDAKLLAEYIEILASIPTTNSINLIGLSKCGVMSFYVPRFFKQAVTFSKTNIYNIATPYQGNKLASPLIFYPEVQKLISSKIDNELVSSFIYNKLIKLYEGISSNSHMDYDIGKLGGIPNDRMHLYDESLIKNIFVDENVSTIKKINCFKNFITGIDEKTLRESFFNRDYIGVGLCMLDELFFDNKSDGMVYTEEQKTVEKVLDIKSYTLESSHHNVSSSQRVISDILKVVDDTVEENDKEKIKIKVNGGF